MSRNEIFLFLACAFAAAIVANPLPPNGSGRVTIVSLLSPGDAGATVDPAAFQHSFDHQ